MEGSLGRRLLFELGTIFAVGLFIWICKDFFWLDLNFFFKEIRLIKDDTFLKNNNSNSSKWLILFCSLLSKFWLNRNSILFFNDIRWETKRKILLGTEKIFFGKIKFLVWIFNRENFRLARPQLVKKNKTMRRRDCSKYYESLVKSQTQLLDKKKSLRSEISSDWLKIQLRKIFRRN